MRMPTHKYLLLIHDVVIISIAIFLSNIFYDNYSAYFSWDELSGEYLIGYILIICTLIVSMRECDLYQYEVVLHRQRQFTAIQKALIFSLVTVVFFSFIFKIADVTAARVLLGLVYINTFLLFLIFRVFIIPNLFFKLVRSSLINRNLLIVGCDKISTEHAFELFHKRNSYFNIVGFVDDEGMETENTIDKIPILGKIKDLDKIVDFYKIQDILVASDYNSDDKLHEIIEICKKSNRTVHILSELYNVAKRKIRIEEIGKVSAFRYQPPQFGHKLIYPYLKRCIDLVLSIVAIIMLLPLWIVLASLIKISSPGPIFYKAPAIGLDGQEFLMYKFRSMRVNVSTSLHREKVIKMIQDNEATKKIVRDPRITKVGRFIRKYSFDEFPQLLNVLIGEMSLVGPRPCLPYEYEVMKEWQKQRCNIKPGMTGIWQITGRDEVLFSEQVILDLYYKEHRSIFMDLRIMINTIPVMILGKGGA